MPCGGVCRSAPDAAALALSQAPPAPSKGSAPRKNVPNRRQVTATQATTWNCLTGAERKSSSSQFLSSPFSTLLRPSYPPLCGVQRWCSITFRLSLLPCNMRSFRAGSLRDRDSLLRARASTIPQISAITSFPSFLPSEVGALGVVE